VSSTAVAICGIDVVKTAAMDMTCRVGNHIHACEHAQVRDTGIMIRNTKKARIAVLARLSFQQVDTATSFSIDCPDRRAGPPQPLSVADKKGLN